MVWVSLWPACPKLPPAFQWEARGGDLASCRGRRAWQAVVPPITASHRLGTQVGCSPQMPALRGISWSSLGFYSLPNREGETTVGPQVQARGPESPGNQLAEEITEKTASGRRRKAAPARAPGTKSAGWHSADPGTPDTPALGAN